MTSARQVLTLLVAFAAGLLVRHLSDRLPSMDIYDDTDDAGDYGAMPPSRWITPYRQGTGSQTITWPHLPDVVVWN